MTPHTENLTVVDFECTYQIDENKRKDPSPNNPKNYLVSYGVDHKETLYYKCLQHNIKVSDEGAAPLLQDILDNTDLLIAHNCKFELMWLKSCGFHYEGKTFDTMLAAYVLARGQKLPVSLEECCVRYNTSHKKSELVDKYLKQNIGFEEIPWEIVEEYGIGDVVSTKELYFRLVEELNKAPHLWPTVNLMNEFCCCLTDLELNGINIDIAELDRLEVEYKTESNKLKLELRDLIKEVMGDTEINIESPEQLSKVLYSREVIDKAAWKEAFNLGTELRGSVRKPKRKPRMSDKDFVENIKKYTRIVYKTTASQCPECKGSGKIQRIKKDGNNFSKLSYCPVCTSRGICYTEDRTRIAGFKLIPSSPSQTAVGGFATDAELLSRLREGAKGSARLFLEKLERANSISVYLSSFIGGIRRGLRNGVLHPSFMQHITATGRLSSRNPSFQNQPRNATFPIRKCVVSRFPDGLILSGDAKQLEFRIAGELSRDAQIFEDVIAGIDVHANTAVWTGLNRQDSKPYTFAPVYGATDRGKPEHIAKYFRFFQDRYKGLFNAHKEWQNTVLDKGSFILPSGREFIYPGTIRYSNGSVSNSTIIANYPVQAFATADLMPIFCLNVWKLYKEHNLKSLCVIEVHDDMTVDVYPGELEIAARLMVQAFNSLPEECLKRYNYELKMPLEIELKVGTSWFNQKEYKIQ